MSFDLGEMSALVTLDKEEFDRGMDSLPGKAENAFKKIAGLAASYLSFRSLMGSVNAYFTQQDAVEGLRSSLRNLGYQYRQSLEEYQKFAAEMQQRTRYGDEGTLQVMSQGVRLGIDPSKLKEVTEAAIGLAERVGIDLPNAMSLLARASQGHTEMLARYGVQIDSTKDKAEQFNDVLKWSREGIAMAEDAALTAKGGLEQMKNALGDASEEFGKGIAEGLRPVWTSVKEMSEAFSGASDTVKRLTSETGLLAASLVALGTIGVSVTGPVGLAIAGVAALAIGLNEIGAKERSEHEARRRRFADEYADARSLENANRRLIASDRERMARLQQLSGFIDLTNAEQKEAEEIVAELTKKYGDLGIAYDSVNKRLSVQSSTIGMVGRLRELADRQSVTNAEQKEAERIAEQLNKAYHGLELEVENVSGKLVLQGEGWEELVRLQKLARETAGASVEMPPSAFGMVGRLIELSQKQGIANKEQEEAKRIAESLNGVYHGLGITIENVAGKLKVQADGWDDLTRLHQLARITIGLSNSEQAEARRLIEELTKKYGDFGVSFDEATGKIVAQADAWERLTEAQRKNAIEDAKRTLQVARRDAESSIAEFRKQHDGFFDNNRNMAAIIENDLFKKYVYEGADVALERARSYRNDFDKPEYKGFLWSKGYADMIPHIDEIIKKLEKVVDEEGRIEEMRKSADLPPTPPAEPKEGGNGDSGDTPSRKGKSDEETLLESIKELRWQNEYNGLDKDGQMKMLVGKLFDLNLRLNETAMNKDESEYNVEELELLKNITIIGGQLDRLRKDMDKDAEKQEETRNYSDNYGSFYAQALSYSHANNHQEKIAENTKKTAQNTKETKDAVDNLSANLTWG